MVASALSETNKLIQDDGMKWELVEPLALQHWNRRGNSVSGLSDDQAHCLIRVDGKDAEETSGFFVSYFERKRIREKCFSKPLPIRSYVSLTPGVKSFYKGEFRVQKDKETAVGFDDQNHMVQNVKKEKSDLKIHFNDAKISKTSKAKIAKKIAKKIKWKQKQKEEKLLRLKKKEAKNLKLKKEDVNSKSSKSS